VRRITSHQPVATHFEIPHAELEDDRPEPKGARVLRFGIPIPGAAFELSTTADKEIRLRAQETWPADYLVGHPVRIKMLDRTIDGIILRRARKEILLRGRFVA
jgi:hypothetical protein